MAINENLNDQIFIGAFKDPTVALETTQFNQTYPFRQDHQTYGDVTDQTNLSPDWNYFSQSGENTYASVDNIEWTLYQPSHITESVTPDEQIAHTTTQVNDYIPTMRQAYQQDLSYPDVSNYQTQLGRLTVPGWEYIGRDSSGHADY